MRIACAFVFLILSNKGIAMDLSEYKGKVVLVVNIATRCGYTGQLDGLEKLYQRFKDKGLVVLGVPSNDFGSQTPEGNDEVKKFCQLNYGVSFPLTPKMVVSGAQKDSLFKWLTKSENAEKEIAWNFEKFLINRTGKLINRFPSKIAPDDVQLTQAISAALSK